MKKLFFTAFAVCIALLGKAQLVEVASIEHISTPDNLVSEMATISPDGTYAIVGSLSGSTLSKVDLATGATSVVTKNGSVQGVAISPDGLNVVFRTTTMKNNLRLTGLSSVNIATGAEKQLVKPSRKLNAGVGLTATGVTAIENGRVSISALGNARATSAPVASINYGHLDITVNGKTTTIDPQGRGSYLWPSISPDGTKVVYYLSGRGAFVCNLDGSNVQKIGLLRAAKWMGNDMLVGMQDYDNGAQYTASSIVVSDLKGKMQTITNEGMIALYPSASADGKSILFSTYAGELYLVNLK